jgi:hypothetical protein
MAGATPELRALPGHCRLGLPDDRLHDARLARLVDEVRVVLDEAIAKDIGVSEDRVRQLREAMQEMRGQGGGDPGEMRKTMHEKAVSILSADHILSADQKAKLEALRGPAFDVSKLQMRGPGGGGRPGNGT